MGGAMLDGWLAAGLDPRRVTILEPHPSTRLRGLEASGLSLNPETPGPPPSVLVLATKPQTLSASAAGFVPLVSPDTLVVSIIAGKTVADLTRVCPGARAIVRAMPNLPASIGRGASGAFANSGTSPDQRRIADALLSQVGLIEWVEDERLIDAVTAVSGSGPAYLFHLVECLAEAGVAAGLDPAVAARLARATVTGAAALLDESGEDPARLRENVTSPGGTTAAALDVLRSERGLAPLLREAVLAARRRAGELSG